MFKPFAGIPLRDDLGQFLEMDGQKVGAEIGVHVGCSPLEPCGLNKPIACLMTPSPASIDTVLPNPLLQKGEFAHKMLSTWPSCTKYYMIDLWSRQVRDRLLNHD